MTPDPEGTGKWRRRAEHLRTWLPLLISVCAISLTIFQAAASRRHTRLSVQPRVDWRLLQEGSTGEVSISLVNSGFGPAIITHSAILHDGVELGRSGFAACDKLAEVLDRTGPDWDTSCFVLGDDYVLRPGETVRLFGSKPAPGRPAPPVAIPFEALSVNADYCSFYEDCWSMADH